MMYLEKCISIAFRTYLKMHNTCLRVLLRFDAILNFHENIFEKDHHAWSVSVVCVRRMVLRSRRDLAPVTEEFCSFGRIFAPVKKEILLRPPKPHRHLGDGYPDKSRVWGQVWLHALQIVLTQCSHLQRTPLLQTCAFVWRTCRVIFSVYLLDMCGNVDWHLWRVVVTSIELDTNNMAMFEERIQNFSHLNKSLSPG